MLLSMTFQTWKMVLLNSTIFYEMADTLYTQQLTRLGLLGLRELGGHTKIKNKIKLSKDVYDGHQSCRYWNPKCVDRWQRNRKSEQVQIVGVVSHG